MLTIRGDFMRRISLLLICLTTYCLTLAQQDAPPDNYIGCSNVESALRKVEDRLWGSAKDKSLRSGNYEVFTCCGGAKLFAQVKKNAPNDVTLYSIEGWTVLDAKKRNLDIEVDKKEIEDSPGATSVTVITRIRAKRDQKVVACFFFEKEY